MKEEPVTPPDPPGTGAFVTLAVMIDNAIFASFSSSLFIFKAFAVCETGREVVPGGAAGRRNWREPAGGG